ncbi:hypothetical protein [Methylobacterium sp. ap11]|uniref:hypothetical protein n=1 Tax=Methylobacterium sp. ap11 TaxID=1761799 RepID=UPI000ADDDF4D|nr:hypothetical protein [Methylobacterium sp. ap11]
MTDPNPIDALIQRRNANVTKATRLSEQLVALRRENDEIDIAIKALDRLGFKGAPPGKPAESTAAGLVQAKLIDITVPDMIFAIIGDDIIGDGVDASTIIAEIKRRYMPDPDPNIIRPTLWRLTKAGRLMKMGGKYFLPDPSSIEEEEEEDESESDDSSSSKNGPAGGGASAGPDAESEYEDDIL